VKRTRICLTRVSTFQLFDSSPRDRGIANVGAHRGVVDGFFLRR
jgi:hypothetical protein